MARKFVFSIKNVCLIVGALMASIVVFACQSADSGATDVPLDVRMMFRDDKPYRQPDLARWSFEGGSGEAKLGIAPATNEITASFLLPRTPGTDTVKLYCWRNGLLSYVVPAVGDADLSVKTDKVVHQKLAQAVLLRQSELHLDDPAFFGDDALGARRTYAKLLVDRDSLVEGYPATIPEGIDTVALLDDICVAMARRKLSFDSLYSPGRLGRDSATWHGIVLARIAARILASADSAVLFPPDPVRVERSINVKNALVAGGDESVIEGVFGWFPGMVALDAVVMNGADTARGLFDVAVLQPQSVMDTLWSLEGRATIRARSAVAAGDYELRIVVRDVKGNQAESRTKFTVMAPPSEVPRLVRLEPEGGDTVRLPFSKSSIRIAFAVRKPENVKSESFTIAGLAATRESDSVWAATVAVPPTGSAAIVAVRVLSKEDQPGTEYLFVVRERDRLPPEVAAVVGNVDREVPFDSAYADVGWVVKDDHMVGSVEVGGVAVTRTDSAWMRRVKLVVGENVIRIMAKDSTGNESSKDVKIVRLADTEKPKLVSMLSEQDLEVYGDAAVQVAISFQATDNHKVERVSIDGQPALRSVAGDIWSRTVVAKDGDNKILVIAWDSTGNENSDSVVIHKVSNPDRPIVHTAPGTKTRSVPFETRELALSWVVLNPKCLKQVTISGKPVESVDGRFTLKIELQVGDTTVIMRAEDTVGNSTSSAVKITRERDTLFPKIVAGPISVEMIGPIARVTASWVVTDNDRVALVKIEDADATRVGNVYGRTFDLKPGQDKIRVYAQDGFGNTSVDSANVVLDADIEPPKIVEGTGTKSGVVGQEVEELLLNWIVTDNRSVAKVEIDGVPVEGVGAAFGRQVKLDLGRNPVLIDAWDAAGNKSSTSVEIVRLDQTGPTISDIQGLPAQPVPQGAESVAISFKVDDETGIGKVTVGGVVVVEGKDGVYTAQVPLLVGSNSIEIVAIDKDGTPTTKSIVVVRNDETAPVVVEKNPSTASVQDGQATYDLAWTVSDNSGAFAATLDGKPLACAAGVCAKTVDLAYGVNTFAFVAQDASGNKTPVSTKITRLDQLAPTITMVAPVSATTPVVVSDAAAVAVIKWTFSDNVGVAFCEANGSPVTALTGVYSLSVDMAAKFGDSLVKIVASDPNGNVSETTMITIRHADGIKPKIALSSPSQDTTVKDVATFIVKWTASDNRALASLKINGTTVTVPGTGTYSQSVALSYGANSITIVAKDAAGNDSTKVLNIARVDATKPDIVLLDPSKDTSINETSSYLVKWTASDNRALASLMINGAAVTLPGTGTYSQAMGLSYGANTITIAAKDAAGNDSTKVLKITRVDTTKPTVVRSVGTTSMTVPYGTTSIATGWKVTDNQGVQSVSIGGVAVTVSGGSYSRSVPLSTGVNKILLVALDQAGNETRDSIYVIRPSVTLGAIAAGGNFGLYMSPSGVVTGWGSVTVPLTLGTVKAIAATDDYGLALDASGGVKIWYSSGVLQPVPVVLQSGVRSIAAGANLAVAVMAADSSVKVWTLGSSTINTLNLPAGLKAISAVVGSGYCMAIDKDSSLKVWATSAGAALPTTTDNGIKLRSISASHGQAIGVTAGNELMIWGPEGYTGPYPTLPRPGSLTGMMDGAAGYYHTMARHEDGTMLGWGYDGATQARILAAAPTDVVAVSVGYRYTLAMRSNGSLYAWGDNSSSQTTVPVVP